MKNEKQHWAVILFNNVASLVVLDENDPNKWYWFGTYSWCSLEGGPEIIKDYGYISVNDDEEDNRVHLDFYTHFNVPKKAAPHESAGWLAPDGSFYPCAYWQHDSYASHLAAIYYQSLEGVRKLEEEGWVRIYSIGVLGNVDWEKGVTQKQLDTLYDIATSAGADKEFKKNFQDALNLLTRKV